MPKLQIDSFINTVNPAEAGDMSAALEQLGCDGIATFEGPHEPFLPLAVAAQKTRSARLYTAVAIAFARNPMVLANLANDMQLLSQGRFGLGLGSQIRPHIEKRYSMPWSHPVERMREFVQAIRAIWRCWESNEALEFRGQFYTHTLMTPLFNPGPNQYGWPSIALAGVGKRMTEMAGEVADCFIVHPFHTLESLQKLTLPALHAGAAKRASELATLEINCQVIVACGRDDKELSTSIDAARMQIAFYGSTPAYRPVLECSGLGELQTRLNALSKQGKWTEMAEQIDDDLLHRIAVVGSPEQVAKKLVTERGALVQRVAPSIHITSTQMQHELLGALIKERDRA